MSDDVYIIGVGMIKFGKYLDKGIKALTGEALDLGLKDCGLCLDDIEAAWFSNSSWGRRPHRKSPEGTHPSWISMPWAPACTWSASDPFSGSLP